MNETTDPGMTPETATATQAAPPTIPRELWIDELHEEPFNELLLAPIRWGSGLTRKRHDIIWFSNCCAFTQPWHDPFCRWHR
jgi:hypothetical protein